MPIFQCFGCRNALDVYDNPNVEVEDFGGVRIRMHKPCRYRVEPIAVEVTDDVAHWAELLISRTNRLVKLLSLDAPTMIVAEERRMIKEAAEIVCLFS